jgi:endonuclease/exonuclease/phosphatase family metal-dependent hydrolase
MPLVVTGDMNEALDDPALDVFTSAMLRDSYTDVADDAPPTIHHFGERYGRKIDFVLCDPNWKVVDARIVVERPDGQWPSDHFPVIADLELIEDAETPTG